MRASLQPMAVQGTRCARTTPIIADAGEQALAASIS
jgi:hypothetical protein